MVHAQTSVQYTPVQVLQAARRAEAEGKMDYALQFYRHIVEHHGSTEEAAAAREGLFRIAEWRWGEARIARRQEAAAASRSGQQSPPPAPDQPHFSRHGETVEVPPLPSDNSRLPQIITREASNDDDDDALVHYRVPKIFAFIVSGLGWAGVLAGVVLAVIAAGNIVAEVSAAALMGLPVGVVVGLPAALLGMMMVVAGHLAVAVFESCNATQELLALERERAG